MAILSLQSLAERLQKQLEIPAIFTSVNTRLIIQVGINLKKIDPDQNYDHAQIRKVIDALSKMGITVANQ